MAPGNWCASTAMKPTQIILPAAMLFCLCMSACKKETVAAARTSSGPVQITVAPVTTKVITRTVESVGTLFPFDETIVSAEVEGRVEKVLADLGDLVSEGQTIARISDEEQRYLVAQNEAQVRQALERLGLKDEKDKVKDIRDTPDVRRAKADLTEAEQRYKRTRELVEQGIGAQSDLDSVQARYQSLQAAYDATLNQTRNLIQEVERYKAVLDLQRKKLRDTTVKAPYAAYVKEKQVTAGQYVQANTPLFTLVKIDPIRLRIEVPERMAPWIRVGQEAQVTLEAFNERIFTGKVWRISPTVDQAKRTFVVEALIQNGKNELKPGSYAKARITTSKTDRVNMVPSQAVNYVLGANKAYVIKGDVVDAREVKIGDRFPQEFEILEGLHEGEQVAVTNLTRLDTGVKVQAAPEAKRSE
jgi:multidrug efflux pump subunit AcrA (membrane-fusion protein)